MRHLRLVVFCTLLCATAAAAPARISSGRYLDHVKYLSSESLKGRGNTRPELEKAARYVEKEMEQAGLRPFASVGGYRQPFEIAAESRLTPSSFLQLGGRRYRHGRDFSLLSFGDQPAGRASVVFCGFGASWIPTDGECSGESLEGKAVVVPETARAGSHGEPGRDVVSRITAARARGAAAVIVVQHAEPRGARHPERIGIVAVGISRSAARRLWGDRPDEVPQESTAQLEASWNLKVVETRRTISNVIGQIAPPGGATEWVVLGAHYDHLGLGERFALDPKAIGQPHYGADDNASGTAGLISLAPLIVSEAARLKRGVIFVAFAGEELGLLGSSHFVRHLPDEARRIVAMINLDMIGRANGRIFVSGLGTAQEFPEMVRLLRSPLVIENSLHIEASQSSVSGSDHMSFTQRGIPALFFFSGLHADYHRATDVWQKINSEAAVDVLEMVRQLIDQIAGTLVELHFVSMPETRPPDSGSGYGAYFGSVPDFAEVPKGVRFSDVTKGSPASEAGLKAGDILVRFDGQEIANLYDFTHALRTHSPGETVEVEFLRGGLTLRARVVLGKRE